MKKLILEVELEYDDETMHGNDADGITWFMDDILMNDGEDTRLVLHSNEIGDEVGTIKVLNVREVRYSKRAKYGGGK